MKDYVVRKELLGNVVPSLGHTDRPISALTKKNCF